MSERWSALIIGECAGLLRARGDEWTGSPEYYERAEVVRADLVDAEMARLTAENAKLRSRLELARRASEATTVWINNVPHYRIDNGRAMKMPRKALEAVEAAWLDQ